MILKQFQKVLELDERIGQMHEELFNLYRERAQIVSDKTAGDEKVRKTAEVTQSASPVRIWAAQEYERLTKTWQFYGIKIPAYSKLEAKLFTAYSVIEDLSVLLPELTGKLGLLLVPPSKQLKFPVQPKYRTSQQLENDLISSGIPKTKLSSSWRLLVVYDQVDGIYLDTPKNILEKNLFVKADYDMTALGPIEYSALSLQNPFLIDDGTWTVLLKDFKNGSASAPYATLNGSRYRFELGQIDSQYGYVRFRPAVEVK